MVGIFTLVFVVLFPIIRGGSASSSYDFATSFGQIALITYVIYFVLSVLFNLIISKRKVSQLFSWVIQLLVLAVVYSYFVTLVYEVATQGVNLGIL